MAKSVYRGCLSTAHGKRIHIVGSEAQNSETILPNKGNIDNLHISLQ